MLISNTQIAFHAKFVQRELIFAGPPIIGISSNVYARLRVAKEFGINLSNEWSYVFNSQHLLF